MYTSLPAASPATTSRSKFAVLTAVVVATGIAVLLLLQSSRPAHARPAGSSQSRLTRLHLNVPAGQHRPVVADSSTQRSSDAWAQSASSVAGNYIGPMPGDTGECGQSTENMILNTDGSYQITVLTDVTASNPGCGGFTLWGTYQTAGGVMYFHNEQSTIPSANPVWDVSAYYTQPATGVLVLSDGTGSWTYYAN
jgi:hypothetical protein